MDCIEDINLDKPHDAFFRAVMSDSATAKEFIKEHLPSEITDKIDFETLEVTQETFIHPSLQRHEVDILMKVEMTQKPGHLYVLVEAQSTPDEWMPFRMIRYTLDIVEKHRKKGLVLFCL